MNAFLGIFLHFFSLNRKTVWKHPALTSQHFTVIIHLHSCPWNNLCLLVYPIYWSCHPHLNRKHPKISDWVLPISENYQQLQYWTFVWLSWPCIIGERSHRGWLHNLSSSLSFLWIALGLKGSPSLLDFCHSLNRPILPTHNIRGLTVRLPKYWSISSLR